MSTARALAAADLAYVDGGTTVTLNITSGASPVDVPLQDPSVSRVIVNVTSGGTGGVEKVNLPLFSPFLDGEGYVEAVNQAVIVVLRDQTDPGDVVRVTVDGSDIGKYFNAGFNLIRNSSGYAEVNLDFLGASAAWVWNFQTWALFNAMTAETFNFTRGGGNTNLFSDLGFAFACRATGNFTATAGSASGSDNSGQVFLNGGANSGSGASGALQIVGGVNSGSGPGGNSDIKGASAAASDGGSLTISGGDGGGAEASGGALYLQGGVNSDTFKVADTAILGGRFVTYASEAAQASLKLPAGTAPTSPENGDIWFDGTNLKIRIGGVTKTVTVA